MSPGQGNSAISYDRNAPHYWRYETGGKLAPAIERYIREEPLTLRDVSLIRDYLRQWVDAPVWEQNPHATFQDQVELVKLRAKVLGAKTKDQLADCIELATRMGMDPL